MSHSKLRVYTVNLLVLGASCAATLVAVEIVLRLVTDPPPRLSTLRSFSEHDASLGWRGVPGASGVYRDRNFAIPVSLNSGGWRDDETASAPPDGRAGGGRAMRIALLGDSYAWGFGVDRGEMFADVVEELRPGWEVENFGVPGFGPDQEVLLLERLLADDGTGRRARPDVVLLQVALLNDVISILRPEAYRLPKPRFVLEESGLLLEGVPVPRVEDWERISTSFRMKEILTRRVRLYSWARTRMRNARDAWAERFGEDDDVFLMRLRIFERKASPRVEKGWRLLEPILERFRDASAAAGAVPVVLVVSDPLQVEAAFWNEVADGLGLDPSVYDGTLPNRRLAEICSRLGIVVIDPHAAFVERSTAGESLFIARDDPHWTAAGHAIAARAIVETLQGLELLE